MEHRPLSVAAQLAAWLLLATPALAADAELEAAWAERMANATKLQQEGAAKRSAANKRYEQQQKECLKLILVNDCRRAAKHEHTQITSEAREQENKGKALERQVKKEQLIDKDNRRVADAPKREAERQAREAETSAARSEALSREAAARADKKKKAEEGMKRKAADAERLQKKRADHEARVARKMKEAERRSVPAGN